MKSCLEKLWRYPDIKSKLLILYQGLKETQWLSASLNMFILQDQIVYLKVSKISLYWYKSVISLKQESAWAQRLWRHSYTLWKDHSSSDCQIFFLFGVKIIIFSYVLRLIFLINLHLFGCFGSWLWPLRASLCRVGSLLWCMDSRGSMPASAARWLSSGFSRCSSLAL